MRRKISPKFHVKKRCEKQKQFHTYFTLLGRSADCNLSNRILRAPSAHGNFIFARMSSSQRGGGYRTATSHALLELRTRRPCTEVKIPKIGKRGFRGQKTPISHQPGKGQFESENPRFSTGHDKENGDFLTQIALFQVGGKWGFFDPETLFSRFWGF